MSSKAAPSRPSRACKLGNETLTILNGRDKETSMGSERRLEPNATPSRPMSRLSSNILHGMFLFRTRPAADDMKQGQAAPPVLDKTAAVSANMTERPRPGTSGRIGSVPHAADTVKTGSKVTGIRAAFERSNKRTPSDTPRGSPGPTKRQDSVPEAKMLSHEAKIARLTDLLEKERDSRKHAEARSISREKEAETLKAELSQKDAYWREELRKKIPEARQENYGPAREMHSSRSSSRIRLAPDNGLQRQLTDLKHSISRSTRVETAITSDSTFVQEMASLAHGIQNWTVNNYRRAKITASAEELTARLGPIVSPRQLGRLKPVWAGWRSENKIAVLQSTVAAMLMDIFDDQLLFGMPQEEWATCLRKTAYHMSAVLEAQQYNRWRASTLDIVRQTSAMSAAADSAASTVSEYITSVLDSLTGMEHSGTKVAPLQPIVRRAITLSHLFRIQRARFSFELPSPMTAFDSKTMENVAFDRDAEEGHPIDCATFPFVLKLGDEHGANVQWQNVLLKANVVCGET